MADSFVLVDQNYIHLMSFKEHAGKDDVLPYRHVLNKDVIKLKIKYLMIYGIPMEFCLSAS